MSELVVAVNRAELKQQGIEYAGIYPVDLTELNQQNYALLPRAYADNKTVGAIGLGAQLPQILGYFQITNHDGRILAYQRKGKEQGLFGKWSIGVGGHVSQEDMFSVADNTGESYPDLVDIVFEGACRELEEELGIKVGWIECLGDIDSFTEAANTIIATDVDKTSAVHVGLPMQIELPEHIYDSIKLDPAEFCNYQWLTPQELKIGDREWETWSDLLIKAM